MVGLERKERRGTGLFRGKCVQLISQTSQNLRKSLGNPKIPRNFHKLKGVRVLERRDCESPRSESRGVGGRAKPRPTRGRVDGGGVVGMRGVCRPNL